MANLKNIKLRIKSISSTQKITRAMKMVASAKVKKSENRVKASRPFTHELEKIFYRLLKSVKSIDAENNKFAQPINNYPVLLEKRDIKSVGILVLTSNKGLSGAFNANVIRYTLKKIKEYNEKGISCKLFIVGQKGYNALKRCTDDYNFTIEKCYLEFDEQPKSAYSTLIASDMAAFFVAKDIDSMELVTTKFKNMMSYIVQSWDILPLDDLDEDYTKESDTEFIVEPDLSSILSIAVPFFISNIIYQALLESVASELASRMTAMSAACNNAEDMIKKLTIDFNKIRQSIITQEITEIVGGASSVNK